MPGFSCGMQTLTCSMWDLIPWPGIKPIAPEVGAQSLNLWTAREVSEIMSFFCSPLQAVHLPQVQERQQMTEWINILWEQDFLWTLKN